MHPLLLLILCLALSIPTAYSQTTERTPSAPTRTEGDGHYRLNADNQPERTKGVRYTIKDGIIYDAQRLLADVRTLVQQAKAAEQQP